MEGLVDEIFCDVLICVGGIDWCVIEFICIIDCLLLVMVFYKLVLELCDGSWICVGMLMCV